VKSVRKRLAALAAAAVLPLSLLVAVPASAAADPQPTQDVEWDDFAKVTLTDEVGEPMSMAVLPDGRVLHTNRQGNIRLFDPETATTRVITSLPVYDFSEDGMQGIALDPDFEDNNWVYIYYSPVIEGFPTGAAPDEVEPGGDTSVFDEYMGYNRLSRFQFVDHPVTPSIDLDSEQEILEVPINRGICCHNGGDIGFDSQGDLYLATGDDTNPFDSDGYTPIDEREYRNPAYDAQRTASNTADLRGKILRITVQEDGSYTVPEDNMFNSGAYDELFPDQTYDPELARPEIYAMGFRNPFRFSVDPVTDALYVGDYGPDALADSDTRGPRATVEWVILDEPRNHGWPYCVGDAVPYFDYDFETEESGELFDCDAPVNGSVNNTGLEELPPVTPAEVYYHNNETSDVFPELGSGGGAPMGGPAYDYDPEVAAEHPTAFPEDFDGIPLFYEWTRNYIKQFHLDEDRTDVAAIEDLVPDEEFNAPMDMEYGPDGSLYVLEYGGDFFVEHEDAQLSRVDYVPDGRSPVARVAADATSGQAPLEVNFSAAASYHPEEGEEIVSYEWSFNDGTTAEGEEATHTYTEEGVHSATLTVTDGDGKTGRAGVTIVVGNTAPEVDIQAPPSGAFFDWGDDLSYLVEVTDVEDETIDCDEVRLNTAIGHDAHAHPVDDHQGCEGDITAPASSGHDPDVNLFLTLTAVYNDQGAGDLPSLRGEDQVSLYPKRRQAEFFAASTDVEVGGSDEDPEHGRNAVVGVAEGDWTAYRPVDLLNIDEIGLRVRSQGDGGAVELRQNAPDGELLGSVEVPDTGGEWETVSTEVEDPGAPFELYLVFSGAEPFDLNYFEGVGEGVAGEPRDPQEPGEPECDGTVVFGGQDSGVENREVDGTCISELLEADGDWDDHGEFVAHVTAVARGLLNDGVIDKDERRDLVQAAAQSDVGKD
jgi:glucose/arabinose dehydrogenase